MQKIKIIGAGLAGCEVAYQLARHGYKVDLYESKTLQKNEIQKMDTFAELVCSNTFRSKSLTNAVGILKEEMKLMDSLILECAQKTSIPSDDALAVDRKLFSDLVTEKIKNNPNINIINEEMHNINENDEITIISSGPLTSIELQQEITRLIGKTKLYYMDASAPIIEKSSIDFSKVYLNSRHKTGDGEYICIPLNAQQFLEFVEDLNNSQKAEIKDFEKEVFFRGCQPIEQMAKKSKKILLNGPMSPNGLENQNELPYAVVQLRQDDAIDSLYNFVGFQTNITWPEQKRIFSKLPGLENAKFVRYGVMHKNYYINSPKILNHKMQVMRKKNVFFAGQITGVEGYLESSANGLICAIGILSYLKNKKIPKLQNNTIIGSLTNYITNEKLKKLNPMKANLGIVDRPKEVIEELQIYKTSQKELKKYLESIKDIFNTKELTC